MIYLDQICCICLNKEQKLEKLSTVQENSLSYYEKLFLLIPEMDIDEIKEEVNVCEGCKICIENLYNFRNKCISNNVLLRKYISTIKNDLNKTDGYTEDYFEYVSKEDSNIVNIEQKDIKTEFEGIDNQRLPLNKINTEQNIYTKTSNILIKQEIDISDHDLDENNSMINSIADIKAESLENYDNISSMDNLNNEPLNVNVKQEITDDSRQYIEYSDNTPGDSRNDDGVDPEPYHLENNRIINNIDSQFNRPHPDDGINIEENSIITKPKKPRAHKHKCETCNKTFISLHDLLRHTRIHTGEKPYKCDHCNKCFNISSNLKKHIKTHTAEKTMKCEVCNEFFINVFALKMHLKTHGITYKCDMCDKSFSLQSLLKRHKLIHRGDKSHKCETCNKLFSNNYDLKRHVRIHTGERPYKCEICNKSFTQLSHFNLHNRTHTGEKPYKCDTCDKSFINCSILRKHIRIHTGEKPYKCEICNRAFTQVDHMILHMKTHTGDKSYKCEICNKGFYRDVDLRKHSVVHSGEKPYQCEICYKSFSQNSFLKNHMRIHTGERPYKCTLCNTSFTTNAILKKHIKTHAVE